MPTDAQVYAKEIRTGFGEFFANWPPGERIQLGDYGTIDNHVFRREGNLLRDFNTSFEVQHSPDSSLAHYGHSSKNSVEVKLRAKGKAKLPTGDQLQAGLDLRFSAAQAVFFNAAGCAVES